MFKRILLLSAVSVCVWAGAALAAPNARDQATATKAAIRSAAPVEGLKSQGLDGGGDTVLTFSAPPREAPEEGARIYQPIAEYLAGVIGRKIVYVHPDNWLTYQTEMLKGGYDIVFDGPHFNSWRIANLKHNTLAKITDEFVFAVVTKKDGGQITDIRHLTGRKVCGMSPPNLGTLALLSQFENPARQPTMINAVGWAKVYEGVVIENKCVAGVLPVANLRKYDGRGNFTRIVYKTKALPNQAFSAGPRITREDQARLAAALIAPEGAAATANLREAFGTEKGLVRAVKDEYAGLDAFLKDVWGYRR